MKPNMRYLILPDVHGREFWVKPVEETLADPAEPRIVFLGDYHDPYPWEFDQDDDYLQRSVDRFREIIELKKKYPKRVTLLIGNHDCGYAISDDICSSRMDRSHRRELEKLFQDNRELFQLAEECDIAGRHIIFSHAGILKGWAEMVWGEDALDPHFNVVDQLNNAWLTDHYGILDALGNYDNFRGWGGGEYGSPVWSDIRSWTKVTPEETYGFNIVGHTQLERPLVMDTIADLDCRKAFYLDDQGVLRSYDTDEIVEKFNVHGNDKY